MTPHGTLEDMARVEKAAGDELRTKFHVETWNDARNCLQMAVHFDFGAAAPLAEHVEFGADMMDRGLFRLPFGVVFYTSQALPETALLATIENPTQSGMDLTVLIISPALLRNSGAMLHIPLMVVKVGGLSWDNARIEWGCATKNPAFQRSTGALLDEKHWESASLKASRFVVGATAMLMSKDIETRIEPAPAKLNAIRARKGRRPVGERRIVKVKPQHQAAYARAADDQRAGRTSPRMHLRRGHFRTLRHERFGVGRVIPVAPSIVNGNDDAQPLAKTYRVEVGR